MFGKGWGRRQTGQGQWGACTLGRVLWASAVPVQVGALPLPCRVLCLFKNGEARYTVDSLWTEALVLPFATFAASLPAFPFLLQAEGQS